MLKPTLSVWNPLAWLFLITFLMAFAAAWMGLGGEGNLDHADRLWGFVVGVLVAWWVYSDRRARGVGMPWEFEAFVVFLWPIVVPYYLYRTRGWYGLVLGVGFWLLFLAPALLFAVTYTASTE
jgi:hypothetical protein